MLGDLMGSPTTLLNCLLPASQPGVDNSAPVPALPGAVSPSVFDMMLPGPATGAGGNSSAPVPALPGAVSPSIFDMMLPGPAVGAGGNSLLAALPGPSPMPIPSANMGLNAMSAPFAPNVLLSAFP
jgi:hypothetical protein